jgi:hypothetical protein
MDKIFLTKKDEGLINLAAARTSGGSGGASIFN